MNRFILLLVASTFFCGTAYATCYGPPMVDATNIVIDLSDKLNERNKTFTYQTFLRIPALPELKCTSYGNTFAYTVASRKVGFNNGAQWVDVKISPIPDLVGLDGGTHPATVLNAPVTLTFTLDSSAGTKEGLTEGNTFNYNEAVIVTDQTGISPLYWTFRMGLWLSTFGWYWTYDERDMYRQNITLIYAPKKTTCSFNNAGLMVDLPKMGFAQLTKNPQPGYTPFTLNFSCEGLQNNGSTDRAIDMFLSSNNLLPSDNSVLMDRTPTAAQGVGIKVVKRDNPNAPVVFSTSTLSRGSATSIFSAAAGTAVNSNFSVGMGAYYFPYNPTQLTSGEIRATATLNIVYQ
ncbi:fimbrial protein [Pseudomonas sp. A34-9]|uniref:fimbrial protein n=1 Tax=Pseudomonas sp. A34-9 TaxID=3034675 RepID=UPI00240E06A9|nr:fimbrial protein [Pseudomonas sp. A34-9]